MTTKITLSFSFNALMSKETDNAPVEVSIVSPLAPAHASSLFLASKTLKTSNLTSSLDNALNAVLAAE